MDDKNNGKKPLDAFAGRRFGGDGKYSRLHQDTLRRERAEQATERIKSFANEAKTLDWARRAVEFCNNEERECKDIADICEGFKMLSTIRKEAQALLDAEKQRIRDKEAEILAKKREQEIKDEQRRRQLELLKKEQELKSIAEESEFVSGLEKIITDLSHSVRDEEWIESVKNTAAIVEGLSKSAHDKIKNRHLLDGFLKESADVQKAIDVDDEVCDLKNAKAKGKAWAESVFKIEKDLDGKHEKYLTQKGTYLELYSFACKIYYTNELALAENLLKKVEKGDVRAAYKDYAKATAAVDRLRDVLYVDDYIQNFSARWLDAVDVIEQLIAEDELKAEEKRRLDREAKEKARIADEKRKKEEMAAAAKREAEARKQAEELRKKQIAEENARKEAEAKAKREAAERKRLAALAYAKKQKKILWITLGAAFAILAASILVGIFTQGLVSSLVFGAGISVAVCVAWFILFNRMSNAGVESGIYLALTIVQLVMGVVCLILDASGVLTVGIMGGAIAVILISFILSEFDLEEFMADCVWVCVLFIGAVLGIGLYFVISGYIGAVVGALVVIAGGILSGIFMLENSPYTGGDVLSGLSSIIAVAGMVALFFGWQWFILGMGAIIASVTASAILWSGDNDVGVFIAPGAGIVGAICAFVALMIYLV